ncbi:MAG: DUF2130 domain-containing protein [Phycisphaerales bacterium]|nr:DUF2130 domain-containing protein [Phycisphaerales bacterium]
MQEATIVCPNCKTEIKLTESLAAPLIESTRRQYEQQIAQKDSDIVKREAAVKEQQAVLAKAQESIDEQVAARLKTERAGIAAAEAKKARDAVADDIAKAHEDKDATEALLKDRDAKLAEARKNELELRQDRQRLQEEKEQFELEKQRAIDAERAKIRESAQKDADEQARLKIAEKDKTITDLQTKLQDALRKAEQGSQQLQGEIQELELEAILREKFPRDTIEPVAKGEHGGDVLHRVFGPSGQPCGTILWESKRTKNWSDGWLAKVREDMRAAGAEVAIVASHVLPKDTDTFSLIGGVWVTSFKCAIPVAVALRHTLIEIAATKTAGEGQQTKMEMVYQYLTGPRFRHRVQAIVEKFTDMHEDLDKERKTMTRLWAKREEQIRGVIESTAGMYGDLQGIAGKTLQEIEGLEVKMLEGSDGPHVA